MATTPRTTRPKNVCTLRGGDVTFFADSPDAVFEAARVGGGVILLRPGSDSGLEDFPYVIWKGMKPEEAVRHAAAGAYVWVAQEDGGWTFAVPLIVRPEAEPEVWLRTMRAGLKTGWIGAEELAWASSRCLVALEHSDWVALLAHPKAAVREWAVRNFSRFARGPRAQSR